MIVITPEFGVPESAHHQPSLGKALSRVSCMKPLLLAMALACSVPAMAMEELAEDDLRGATGEGIALVLNDIALKYGPTSYFELTGTDEAAGTELNHRRGDLRWYGMSYTSANPVSGQTWSGSCSNGFLNLGCPLGGTIANLAPHDNPIVLRAFDYVGTLMDGTTNQTRSIFEVLYPSKHEAYRFAFWGEMNVGTGTTVGTGNTMGSTIGLGGDKLQVQNIWSNINQGGSIVRLFQTSEADASQRTLGLQFINHFEADIRMSVAQGFFSPDTLGQTPEFDDTEGLYIGDYRVHMATGQLHYQALVVDDVAVGNGNFQLKVTQLPNIPSVYNEFYGRTLATDPTAGYDRTLLGASNTDYHKTHGYVRMGDYAPTHRANTNAAYPYNPPAYEATDAPVTNMASEVKACMPDRPACSSGGVDGVNTAGATDDGIFFVAAPGETFRVFQRSPNYMWDGNVDPDTNSNSIINGVSGGYTGTMADRTSVNLGDVNVQGMVMHSLSLTTLGAQ